MIRSAVHDHGPWSLFPAPHQPALAGLRVAQGDPGEDLFQAIPPSLRLHGVLGSSEARFDPQVLLDPPEEKFYLPPLLVEQGDALRGKGKIVGRGKKTGLRFHSPQS